VHKKPEVNERRASYRHLINLNVSLYHDDFGPIKGKITDVSSGGMLVEVEDISNLNKELGDQRLFVKPINMDVIFDMLCLRVSAHAISLQFIS